jgi:hypothetical protein
MSVIRDIWIGIGRMVPAIRDTHVRLVVLVYYQARAMMIDRLRLNAATTVDYPVGLYLCISSCFGHSSLSLFYLSLCIREGRNVHQCDSGGVGDHDGEDKCDNNTNDDEEEENDDNDNDNGDGECVAI